MNSLLSHRVLLLSMVLAIGAFAQPSISPSQLKIGAQAGSSSVVTDLATLLSSGSVGPGAEYELSIRYGSSSAGWLSVTPVHGVTPATLTISAHPSALPAGTYSAQIVASVGSLHLSAVMAVSFIVAPGGANPGGLAVNPSALTFLGDSVSLAQSVTVSNAPGATGTVAFSVFANPSGWLGVTQTDRATPGALKVQPNLSGLSGGVYTGAITVTALSTGKSTVLPITLVVPDSGIGHTITLTPAQRSLTFNYQLSTSSNPTQTVYVSTDSTDYTNFTASASDSWLGVSTASWISPASTAVCFAPGLMYVTVDPTGLSAGVYKANVALTAPGRPSVDLPVTLTVSSTPVLNANPSFVSLDSQSNLLTSNLALTSSDSFFFTAVPNSPWLSITPNSGVASNNITDLTVRANIAALPTGTYNSSITIVGSGGRPTLSVPVQLKVFNATQSNTLEIIPKTLDFSGLSGDVVAPKYVSISSRAGVNETLSLAAVGDGGWFTVDPLSSSAPVYAKVAVSTAVPPGAYTGTILITSLTTGEQESVDVTYKLTARAMAVTPTLLTFTQQEKGSALAPQELQVTANAPSTFGVVSQPAWLSVKPAGPLTTPVKLVVTADASGLAPGSYDGKIQLSGPNDLVVPVTLTIPAPPPPTASPSSIAFVYELGSPAPPAQTVRVSNSTGAVPFSVVASTDSGGSWLVAAPTAGSTPGTITLNVDVSRLTPGRLTGTVAIRLSDASAATLNVAVTLTVTGSAIQIREVWNAATLAPTVLSPGELVTLTGMGLGPITPAVARASSAGAFDTVLGGTQVFFDGVRAPLLLVQDEQINAIVPYALQGRTTARVQVQVNSSYSIPIELKISDAAPGVFTSGAGGRGQAAALNADSTRNSVINPAQRGSVVMIYLTGEGQTDPPGQDGRVISSDLRKPLLPVTAVVGGQPAEVSYAGSGPTLVSGVCQVNVRIPDTLEPGTQSLEIQVGGIPSQRGVTIEVQ